MLGKLAVTQRNHAILNENACEKLRVPITIDDYMNSRMIADPIRLLDCVMRADGAAGLIMMSRSAPRKKASSKYVIPIGYAERTNFLGGENLVDVTRSGHEICRQEGARPPPGWNIKDMRSFHPYDDFIIAIMMQFEAFGFCKPGQGMAFVRDTNFRLQRRRCRSTPAAARFRPARRRARRTTWSRRCGNCRAKPASARSRTPPTRW